MRLSLCAQPAFVTGAADVVLAQVISLGGIMQQMKDPYLPTSGFATIRGIAQTRDASTLCYWDIEQFLSELQLTTNNKMKHGTAPGRS